MIIAMDYVRPMKPFFIEIQNFWAWEDKFWGIFDQTISTHFGTVSPLSMFFIKIQNFWACADKFWVIWGIFGRFISTHFGTESLSMISINQPLFLQKTKPLYPNPKYGIGIWVARNQGFSHRVSVVRA